MFEIHYSPGLSELISRLDNSREIKEFEKLPFPIAYTLKRAQQGKLDWSFLLNDIPQVLLRYLAIISIADYFHSSGKPDLEINSQIRQFSRNLSFGHWLKIIRSCSAGIQNPAIPELLSVFNTIENGKYTAKLIYPRLSIKTQHQGLLSTIITARNKFIGHGTSLLLEEKEEISPYLIELMRASLHLFEPIWKYDLINIISNDKKKTSYLLKGNESFKSVSTPTESCKDISSFLMRDGEFKLQIYPFLISGSPEKNQIPSIICEEHELYLLNQIYKKQIPTFVGLNGGSSRKPYLSQKFGEILDSKRVWDIQDGISYDQIIDQIRIRANNILEDAKANKIYIPDRIVSRKSVSSLFENFLHDEISRALFLTGPSGSGKTCSIIDLFKHQVGKGNVSVLMRGAELPRDIVKHRQIERFFSKDLGVNIDISKLLETVTTHGNGKLLVVFDGIDEFTASNRDASLLFRAINSFISEYENYKSLKVIVSARSEELYAFFPQGKPPPDANIECYYNSDIGGFHELPPLTESETQKILLKNNIPEDKVKEYIAIGKDDIRNPYVIQKVCAGAIEIDDIADLKSSQITDKFLSKRLGRDKELWHVVQKLVKTISKNKDLVISRDALSENSPALLKELQADNNRILTILRELEIIEYLDTYDNEGYPSWSIKITSDKIFTALSRRLGISTLKMSLIPPLMAFAILITSGVVLARFVIQTTLKDLAILQNMTDALVKQSDKILFNNLYLDLLPIHNELINLFVESIVRFAVLLLTLYLATTVSTSIYNYIRILSAGKDPRLHFFKEHFDSCINKKILIFSLPLLVVSSLWTIYNIKAGSVSFTEAGYPVILVLFLFSVILPIWVSVSVKKTVSIGTPLVKECFLSPESLKREIRDYLFDGSLFLTFIILLITIFNTPFDFIISADKYSEFRGELIQGAELVTINQIEKMEPFVVDFYEKRVKLIDIITDSFGHTIEELFHPISPTKLILLLSLVVLCTTALPLISRKFLAYRYQTDRL